MPIYYKFSVGYRFKKIRATNIAATIGYKIDNIAICTFIIGVKIAAIIHTILGSIAIGLFRAGFSSLNLTILINVQFRIVIDVCISCCLYGYVAPYEIGDSRCIINRARNRTLLPHITI